MPTMPRIALSAVFSLAPWLAAQTYVVDAANGPGANFIDLPTAVAAVPDGAVLLVRAGSYQGFTMSGKGITILGGVGVDVASPIAIDHVAASQSVTLRQLNWTMPPVSGIYLLDLAQCAGPVSIEGITQPAGWYSGFGGSGVRANSCDALTLRECQILSKVFLSASFAVIESCEIRGEDWSRWAMLSHGAGAIYLSGGLLQVSGASLIQGGDGWISGPAFHLPGDGINVSSGTLRVLGGVVRSGDVFGASPWGGGEAIHFTGAAPRVSPRVSLFSANTGSPQVPNDDVMPQLTSSGAPIGGTLSATVTTEPGDLTGLVVGLPGPTASLPGFADPFWIDPLLHVFVAIGTGPTLSGTAAVPNHPAFRGLRLVWQAVCQGPVTGLQVTNPSVTLVR